MQERGRKSTRCTTALAREIPQATLVGEMLRRCHRKVSETEIEALKEFSMWKLKTERCVKTYSLRYPK